MFLRCGLSKKSVPYLIVIGDSIFALASVRLATLTMLFNLLFTYSVYHFVTTL